MLQFDLIALDTDLVQYSQTYNYYIEVAANVQVRSLGQGYDPTQYQDLLSYTFKGPSNMFVLYKLSVKLHPKDSKGGLRQEGCTKAKGYRSLEVKATVSTYKVGKYELVKGELKPIVYSLLFTEPKLL